MSSFCHNSISGKLFFNTHLLLVNDYPLKFYLDGYDPYEFHAISKIIEAYGGRLTTPDKETIIFSEPDRNVEKYYYRYNIKYVYDCILANKMLDIQTYLLPRPVNSDMVIQEVPRSNFSAIENQTKALNFQKSSSVNENHDKNTISQSFFTDEKETNDEIFLLDSKEKFLESQKNKEDKLQFFTKKQSNIDSPEIICVESTSSRRKKSHPRTSESEIHDEPDLVCLSEGSDSQLPELDYFPDSSTILNDSYFQSSTTHQSPKVEHRPKRQRTLNPKNRQSSETSINSNFPTTSNEDVRNDEILADCNNYLVYAISSDSETEFEATHKKLSINKRTVARKSTTKNGGVVANRVEGKENKKVRRKIKYSNEENQKIIQYLIKKNAISRSEGIAIWKEIEKDGILMNPRRSAINLQSYFLRSLKYKFAEFTEDPQALEAFRRLVYNKQSK